VDYAVSYASAELEPAMRDTIRIPNGTSRMGSDKRYPEEASAHRMTVSGFWIDHTPVTNVSSRSSSGATYRTPRSRP
jgi:sulfatase modifying factor 1